MLFLFKFCLTEIPCYLALTFLLNGVVKRPVPKIATCEKLWGLISPLYFTFFSSNKDANLNVIRRKYNSQNRIGLVVFVIGFLICFG